MMKKLRRRIPCLLLALVLALTFMQPAFAQDAQGHWAKPAIDRLIKEGAVLPDDSGNTYPDRQLTRAEMAKLLTELFEITLEGDISHFTDIKSSDWFAGYMSIAYGSGIFLGDGDKMRPNDPITRQEVAVVFARILKLAGDEEAVNQLADASLIPSWAKGAVGALIKQGMLTGYPDGTFRGAANMTRAEAFTLLVNAKFGATEDTAADPATGTTTSGSVQAPERTSSGGSGGGSSKYADIVIQNGLIYTVDADQTEAEALAIKNGEIIYVGHETGAAVYIGKKTEVIDLDGGMALPGFIDSHGHPSAAVGELYNLNLSSYSTKEEYLQATRAYYAANPDMETLVGFGWNSTLMGTLTKAPLDEITTEIPIVLADAGQHIRWMNSKALEVAGITRGAIIPPGANVVKDGNGEPTGIVADYPGLGSIFSKYSVGQFEEALVYYQEEIGHPLGITSVFDDSNRSILNCVEAYNNLEAADKLKMRVGFYMRFVDSTDLAGSIDIIATEKAKTEGGLFNVHGVKIFMDGVLEGHTAYMEDAYVDTIGGHGSFSWEGRETEIMDACAYADALGLTLHFHAIGNAAVRTALDCIEFAQDENGIRDSRCGITHIQIVNEIDFSRFASMGVTAVPQPFWFIMDEYYDVAIDFVGQELADQQYPMASFFDAGVLVASGSDYPVQSPRPLDAIENGVTRRIAGEPADAPFLPKESERVSLAQMIESYTINGAKANFLENVTGSSEAGKRADIVILDKNLFELPSNEIATATEMITIFDGDIVYRAE